MAGRNLDYLAGQLAAGGFEMGQIRVEPSFEITHKEDIGRDGLTVFGNPHDAIVIARHDGAGRYRPLKTAPNLARGWRLKLSALDEVLLALDFLYPAELGTAAWQAAGQLRPVGLRETLGRQGGMYAVTRKLSDAQAGELIEKFCHKGCLRQILWPLDGEVVAGCFVERSGVVPLLCAEACNLFVAEARKVVKAASL
jgi:sirohydrochlorin cobaltochelatase